MPPIIFGAVNVDGFTLLKLVSATDVIVEGMDNVLIPVQPEKV
jgi:hypothetical protein